LGLKLPPWILGIEKGQTRPELPVYPQPPLHRVFQPFNPASSPLIEEPLFSDENFKMTSIFHQAGERNKIEIIRGRTSLPPDFISRGGRVPVAENSFPPVRLVSTPVRVISLADPPRVFNARRLFLKSDLLKSILVLCFVL
jgi:hypothetical protein